MRHFQKISLILILAVFASAATMAQQEKPYDPSLDGHEQLKKAVEMTKVEGKHVLIMVGGNW